MAVCSAGGLCLPWRRSCSSSRHGEPVTAARRQRVGRQARRERQGRGARDVHRERAAEARARLGRRQREPTGARLEAGRVQARLLGRLRQVPQRRTGRRSAPRAAPTTARRSRGGWPRARRRTARTGRSRRGSASCRTTACPRPAARPGGSCTSRTGRARCRCSRSRSTGSSAATTTSSARTR